MATDASKYAMPPARGQGAQQCSARGQGLGFPRGKVGPLESGEHVPSLLTTRHQLQLTPFAAGNTCITDSALPPKHTHTHAHSPPGTKITSPGSCRKSIGLCSAESVGYTSSSHCSEVSDSQLPSEEEV